MIKSYQLDKDFFDSYGPTVSMKRNHKDDDDKEDPSTGPNKGKKTKRSRTNEFEKSKNHRPPKNHLKMMINHQMTQLKLRTKLKSKISSNNLQGLLLLIKNGTSVKLWMINLNNLVPVYELVKGTCKSNIEHEYNMEDYFKALTDKLDWNNPKGDRCPFDLTKPLPLKGHPGRLTIVAEYFFNNDLDFLKSSDPEKKYTTYITKIRAAQYEIVGIEDMKILSVVSVKVERSHGYGHLEEIMARRADRQIYTNLKKKMSARDKRRSSLMVDLIDKQMLERQVIRNLERLVGARELKMDDRLMTHTA
nr:hypothetical protein [Tanacetum cinerariifolium]